MTDKRTIRLSSLTLVRAIGITLIVVNHAFQVEGWTFLLHGGTNVLLLVFGLMLAMFGFAGTTQQTASTFLRFTKRIAWPAFGLVLFSAIFEKEFRPGEFAFVSNWFTLERVTRFHIWYIQVIVQILLMFYLFFRLADLTPVVRRHPLRFSLIALVLSFALLIAVDSLWPTGLRIPPYYLWNVVLGWTLWAALYQGERNPRSRWLASAVLILSASVGLLAVQGPDPSWTRWVCLVAAGLILIWSEGVRLPRLVARPVLLISQAVFPIYLLHNLVFTSLGIIERSFGWEGLGSSPTLRFLAAMTIPTLLWALATALRRAARRLDTPPVLSSSPS